MNTYARGSSSATQAGPAYFGIAKSHGAKVSGLRLVLTTPTEQVVDDWMLAPASHPNRATGRPLGPALLEDHASLQVLGDGAYHGPLSESVLAEKHGIHLLAPPRKDSRTPWPEGLRQTAGALRARFRRNIETALSILAVALHVERPNARSLHGLVCRIST